MESKQKYDFDIILTKTSVPPHQEEDDYHIYSIRLFKEFIDLPERRVRTDRFPSKPLGSIECTPCELVTSLNTKGVCVTFYEDGELVACGNVKLSSSLLRKLAEQNFVINETVSVPLEKKKKVFATVELIIKFSCVDPNLDTSLLPFGCYDICKPLDKSINPRDVMFTMGRSATGAVSTCITDERLMSHAGPPFSCLPTKPGPTKEECGCFITGLKPPPQLDPTKERERKLLKKLLMDLDIDKPRVPTPPSGHFKAKSCKCQKARATSGSEFVGQQNEEPTQEQQQMRKRSLGVCPDAESPELTSPAYKPAVLCPVCKANISWLPKVANCPYCGYKRFEMDVPSEEPFDETATAAEVLQNYLEQTKLRSTDESERRDQQPGSKAKDCTCSSNRVCTRCRIRELCEQMFQMSSATKVQLPSQQQVAETSGKAVNKKSSTASERRKHLVSIFTEMRDVYGEKKEPPIDPEAEKLQKQCAAECRKHVGKSSRGRRRTSRALKQALKELEEGYPSKLRKPRKTITKTRLRSKRYTFIERKNPDMTVKTHELCARGYGRVPCHMGWMWTKCELARHRCWKPGAITKPIRELMTYFLKDYPVDVIGPSRMHCPRRKKMTPPITEEPLVQHPTLHITKKHDEYVITLRPLKDANSLSRAANPYANMKPVVFRITKDPIAAGQRQMKLSLMKEGFSACTCNQPVADCFCRSHVDKKILEHKVQTMSEERGWADITDSFVFSPLSESDSEDELEFGVTPPAGVIKPERLIQTDRAHCETQYNENDWAMPTMYPHPPNALVQYGGCVVGERKDRFPYIFGKGYVHRVPPPAKKINKPKETKKEKEREKGGYTGVKFQMGYPGMVPRRHVSWEQTDVPYTYARGPVR